MPASQKPPEPTVKNRSVRNLSEDQLKRKRANDREAQRIIRKRTKEQIGKLERQVAELGDQKEQFNKALRHISQLEAQTAALQHITKVAVLQYGQSPGVYGNTDTALAYGMGSYLLQSPPLLPPGKLTGYRPKCNKRAQRLSSITRMRGITTKRLADARA